MSQQDRGPTADEDHKDARPRKGNRAVENAGAKAVGAGEGPLAALIARAVAMVALGADAQAAEQQAIFASMALAALPETAEKEVLRSIKVVTGKPLSALWRDYRLVKGDTSAAVTEDRVAREIVDRGGLLFCHTRKSWFICDRESGIWRRDETRRVKDIARSAAREAGVRGVARDRATAGRDAFVSGVERLAQTDARVAATITDFDADPHLLGTPGGVVDLKTGSYMAAAAAAKSRVSRVTATSPAATAECPRFLQFLQEATGNNDAFIEHAQRVLGYALYGEKVEHVLVFVHGQGGNGKSLLASTMEWVLGGYSETASMDAFTATSGTKHPTDLAKLAGARLVTAAETAVGRGWDMQRLKQVTGGEKISARFMHKDEFTYEPQFLLLVTGNSKPTIDSVGEAERRRFLVWPFTHQPPVKDTKLSDKLKAEGPGILRWLIEGCRKWQVARDAEEADALARPAVVKTATSEYLSEQETLRDFIEERCEVGPELRAKPQALLDSHSDWARKRCEDQLKARAFKAAMERLGYVQRVSQGRSSWHGIALRADDRERHSFDGRNRNPFDDGARTQIDDIG